jgi:CO/xanthine dehydrogenase Mo-binding subunit
MSPWKPQPLRVESRIRLEPDGTVVALSGKIEYGQGIRTAFAKVVAGELGVPFDRVRVVLGETDDVPWDMGTFGSMSIANDGAALRRAAAFARERLLDRAADRLGVPRADLDVQTGRARRRRPGHR